MLQDGTIEGYSGALHTNRQATPFILLNINGGASISETQLRDFRSLLEADPSFQADFLRLIVFQGAEEGDVDLQPPALELLHGEWKSAWEFGKFRGMPALDSGPYIGYQGRIFQPWRLYHDENLTMTMTYQPRHGSVQSTFGVLTL